MQLGRDRSQSSSDLLMISQKSTQDSSGENDTADIMFSDVQNDIQSFALADDHVACAVCNDLNSESNCKLDALISELEQLHEEFSGIMSQQQGEEHSQLERDEWVSQPELCKMANFLSTLFSDGAELLLLCSPASTGSPADQVRVCHTTFVPFAVNTAEIFRPTIFRPLYKKHADSSCITSHLLHRIRNGHSCLV